MIYNEDDPLPAIMVRALAIHTVALLQNRKPEDVARERYPNDQELIAMVGPEKETDA